MVPWVLLCLGTSVGVVQGTAVTGTSVTVLPEPAIELATPSSLTFGLTVTTQLSGPTVSGHCTSNSAFDGTWVYHNTNSVTGAPSYTNGAGLYLYYDPSCSGSGSGTSRWIFDSDDPSTSAASDLDGDSACSYSARIDSTQTVHPPTGANTWRSACPGWTDSTVTITFEKITVVADQPIWLANAATYVTCTATLDTGGGASSSNLFATAGGGFAITSSSAPTTTVEFYPGGTIAASGVLLITCSSNFAQHVARDTWLTFVFDTSQDADDVSSTGYRTSAAGVGHDPIAYFGGVEQEFELPPQVLTTLLTTDEIIVQCSVFEGAFWNNTHGSFQEQWFDHFVLKTPNSATSMEHGRFLAVKVKRNLHELNISQLPGSEFFTLDITMGYGNNESSARYTSRVTSDLRVLPFWLLEHDVVIHRLSGTSRAFRSHRIGAIPSECVEVHGSQLHFAICSRPADYYTGRLRMLSVKYAHLDLVVIDIKDKDALRGLLPELWGIRPMSESTKAYLKKVDMA
eukprot:TRINITY_DN10114_c0_g1_i2.p1 TRINITY_DN10114_c0_g1~~TRINITY_DN10114_c0_g1_i2.p1  ORF type:complete len:514 (-),score=59.56 TRINITY_DN10114_c0_g1_i2:160-1701(-)